MAELAFDHAHVFVSDRAAAEQWYARVLGFKRSPELERWQAHLGQALAGKVTQEDHTVSMSLYFADPDGNPYEITTYERVA
jgi:catechol-2,3-dioxygenase